MLLLCQFHSIQEDAQILYRHVGHLINIFICNSNCKGTLLQTLSMAGCTRRNTHKLLILLLHGIRAGLPVTTLHIFNQSFPVEIIHTFSTLSLIMYLENSSIPAMNQHMTDFFWQVTIRRIQRKTISFGQCP